MVRKINIEFLTSAPPNPIPTGDENISIVEYEVSITNLGDKATFIGCDPGSVNMAIAISSKNMAYLYQIKMTRDANPVTRILRTRKAVKCCMPGMNNFLPTFVTLEGSAHAGWRTTEMAEVRAAIIMELLEYTYDIKVVTPNSIRKVVFGNGRTKAHEYWKDTQLPPDALAALSMMYYSALTT